MKEKKMNNKLIRLFFLSGLLIIFFLVGCAGKLTVIPRGKGNVIVGSYSDGMGETSIKLTVV